LLDCKTPVRAIRVTGKSLWDKDVEQIHFRLTGKSLGDEVVEFMHFRLETLQCPEEHEMLVKYSLHPEVWRKAKAWDFQGALAIYNGVDLLLLNRHSRQFFLQERGILQRLAGNLDEALKDLSAALDLDGDDYECYKHRGYVKYLKGDSEGARLDAEKCLAMGLPGYNCITTELNCLGVTSVEYMDYSLR
jgi:tetratricopeptide (TPR) repeat protein